jgi:hypothetical protein
VSYNKSGLMSKQPIKLYNLTSQTSYKLEVKQTMSEKLKPVWEATKEPLRLLVLAVIPFILVYFQAINAQWAVLITVVLRYIDKLLHEYGKENDNLSLEKGITRF